MDKKKGMLNVAVSIIFKILIVLSQIVVRRFLIQQIGNDANGIYSLYVSVIGVLAVAELGVGSAITFSMYRPIVENDYRKVSALYRLFRRIYMIVGVIIFLGGLATLPFLPDLAKGYETSNIDLSKTFLIMLLSVSLQYLFSAKTALFTAHKNDYIATTISSSGQLIQYALQLWVLIQYRSFSLYLLCAVVGTLVQWSITEVVFFRKYKKKVCFKEKLDKETRREVAKNVKAMFMHKVGTVLVNTVDSMIISAFIGVEILGKYTNYTTIAIAMTSLLSLLFVPLTSTIGHLYVEDNKDSVNKYFSFFHSLNYIVAVVFFWDITQ